ncbi:MAG: hypothetical protein IBX61_09410 [Thermoleophilia bacterium]|nr:hypothetical protein [Thermoleophilia bacterium]
MSKYVSFDQARKEREGKSREISGVFGQTWHLPNAMPAAAYLELLRFQKEKGDEHTFTRQEQLDLIEKLVPGPVFKAWLAEGMTLEDTDLLLPLVVAAYNDTGAIEGEAKAPKKGAKS